MQLVTVKHSLAQVCPAREDLLHAHFRKLCRLCADCDEWGQVCTVTRTQSLAVEPKLQQSTAEPLTLRAHSRNAVCVRAYLCVRNCVWDIAVAFGWGAQRLKRAPTQIVIINTLMRYARANFTDPAILEAEKAAKKVPKEKRAKTEKKKVSLRRVGSLLYVGLPVESGRLRRVGSLGQHCSSGLL
jgi:hypothetical protein